MKAMEGKSSQLVTLSESSMESSDRGSGSRRCTATLVSTNRRVVDTISSIVSFRRLGVSSFGLLVIQLRPNGHGLF